MRELFQMDRQNYNPEGKVYRRPSARAVILKDGIFEQENYYYFCDVTDECVPRKPDEHEILDGAEPVWVDSQSWERTEEAAIRSEIVPDFRECDFGAFEYKNYYDYQVQNGCGYILEEDGSSQAIP